MTKIKEGWPTVKRCGDCMWFDTNEWCHLGYGTCSTTRSNHHQHVLGQAHPACEEYGEPWVKDEN
jgi:hypothetical protein